MITKSTPKTIAEWRSERRKKAKQEGGYIRIPMELWNGEAFHSLTKSEKLVLLECLAQLRYAPKSKKKRHGLTIFKCGLGDLINNGEFGLPTKYLQERGIKGQDTIAQAKKKLVQVGFLDVVTQGSFTKAGRFRYSDRWRTYNSGALLSETGTPISLSTMLTELRKLKRLLLMMLRGSWICLQIMPIQQRGEAIKEVRQIWYIYEMCRNRTEGSFY
jgi:hypothetical protein